MKVLRKIVGKTKIDKISQQIRESCSIQPINEWEERKRTEWDEHTTRKDAERLVKISRDNIPSGRSPGRLKRRWNDLIKTGRIAYKKEEELKISNAPED